jgi:hypothetical protein
MKSCPCHHGTSKWRGALGAGETDVRRFVLWLFPAEADSRRCAAFNPVWCTTCGSACTDRMPPASHSGITFRSRCALRPLRALRTLLPLRPGNTLNSLRAVSRDRFLRNIKAIAEEVP